LTKDLERKSEKKQQHQQAIFHISFNFLFRFIKNELSACSTISLLFPSDPVG
jgi:hypothetical protein